MYETITQLGQTLDEEQLIGHMQEGIVGVFGHIPIAWYRRSTEQEGVLMLHMQERMLVVPATLRAHAIFVIAVQRR